MSDLAETRNLIRLLRKSLVKLDEYPEYKGYLDTVEGHLVDAEVILTQVLTTTIYNQLKGGS